MNVERIIMQRLARLAPATVCAAACASWFDRPTRNVEKVSRLSSGEPASASPSRIAQRALCGLSEAAAPACPGVVESGSPAPLQRAPVFAHRWRLFGGTRTANIERPRRRAHVDHDVLDRRKFAADRGGQIIREMRLDPALQELRRDRQMSGSLRKLIEFKTSEPGAENRFAEFGPQTAADRRPGFLAAGMTGLTDARDNCGVFVKVMGFVKFWRGLSIDVLLGTEIRPPLGQRRRDVRMARVERLVSPSTNHMASMTDGASEDLKQISRAGIERTGRADGNSFHGQYFPRLRNRPFRRCI